MASRPGVWRARPGTGASLDGRKPPLELVEPALCADDGLGEHGRLDGERHGVQGGRAWNVGLPFGDDAERVAETRVAGEQPAGETLYG